ncbi:MAG: helix-turn-helix transcriptional regulator [Planctomycetaceae bacterium]|nr:helix-turn-helix transcriptional regulator [Planctomycetaceae bacterium]
MPRLAPQMPAVLAENAFALFGRNGFDAVTIDEIAARAGVTKGSFYSHYKSKREIVLAACQHYYRAYQQNAHRAIAGLRDPLQRLRAIVEMSVRTCVVDQSTRVFTTEIFALSLKDEQVRSGWLQFYDSVRELYIGLLAAAKAAGQAHVDDPRAAVDLMLAAIEGVKLRAVYEPHIACPAEQRTIVGGLMSILQGQTCPQPGNR